MKILILGTNEKDAIKLINEIKKRFKLKLYNIENDDVKQINSIIINNKNWLIFKNNNINFDVVANQSDKIIYLNYKNNIIDNEQIKKYIRKIIIIKNKKEEKVILKSLDKGHEFYY